MIRLSITVQNIDFVLQTYDRIKVYYDSSPGGTFLTELTDVGSRLLLTESRSVYSFDDPDGSNGRWYKVSYFNSVTSDESNKSGAMQGGAETKQIGWTFENYAPPPDSWGEVLTADDLRYTYLWGIDLVAGNGEWYTDPQIRSHINSSITEIERALTITIKKRVLKCQPADGVAYDEEEDAYPYRHDKWVRSGRLALRRRPVLSVERFEIFTITDQRLLDLKPWLRIDHRKGVLNWFPRTGAIGGSFTQPAFFRLGINQNMGDYPHGYKVDYTAGYADASKVPDDLRDIIGKIAAVKALNIVGDGFIAGFSSSSLSLDGVSESFSSTQSATNAMYGARIQVYLKDIENYIKANRRKFGSWPIGSI